MSEADRLLPTTHQRQQVPFSAFHPIFIVTRLVARCAAGTAGTMLEGDWETTQPQGTVRPALHDEIWKYCQSTGKVQA